ncbi:MAG: glycine--tRNA ligase subunit beta [Endomicrobium sp.]|nr:glycine--tRNA ligase subunit beta [Endomicrobium sp.]
MMYENVKNALLEVRTEEIPFSYIEPALKQIEQIASKFFNASRLKYTSLKTYATPRRLVLIVENLSGRSEDILEEILGPSLKAAKDVYGKYTPAAIGFAAKNGTTPEKLTEKVTEKGEYLSLVKKTIGEKTEKLLAMIFPEIIKNISFPKVMHWETTGFEFARPIRSVIALYGKKIVKFKIADVNSSNWTTGLHACDNTKIRIDLPENYITKMKNKSVIVNQNERKEQIRKSIGHVLKNVGNVVLDDDLIDEVNYLVEYPSAVLCAFDEKYLDLPAEVLTVCMKKSQKCFAVTDKSGKILNCFVGIKNGISMYQEIVKTGYEKVVAARLADAEFFYLNDLKNGLNNNVEKLKGVTFNKEIGTVYDKIERIKKISDIFNRKFNMQINDVLLERAIMLSKTDLVSEMVFEYSELQGIMGRIYALKLSENCDVAESIEQHYWPLSTSEKLPSNKIATVISLADKIDTLAVNFSIGLEPSSSADPYGLKRLGMGFIRIVMKNLPNEDFTDTIAEVFEFLPEIVKKHPKAKNAYERLIDFLWKRVEGVLEFQGYSSNDIKSVVNETKINELKAIGSLQPKLDALQKAKRNDNFASIISMFKRVNNIISQAKKQNINILQINENLLKEETEKNLFDVSKEVKIAVANHMAKNEYEKVFGKVLEMKLVVDSFFEEVMVMAEDKDVKLNRIALLCYVKSIFEGFIDFSALQQ